MIQTYDLLTVDLPVPESANPAAAAAVQELMGGKFGEISTLGAANRASTLCASCFVDSAAFK
jgi:Mn-containing catalase